MELRNFIENVLVQLEDVQNIPQKRRYLVKDLEFELTLNVTENGNIGVSLLGLGSGLEVGTLEGQRVKIKLVPKTHRNNVSIESK